MEGIGRVEFGGPDDLGDQRAVAHRRDDLVLDRRPVGAGRGDGFLVEVEGFEQELAVAEALFEPRQQPLQAECLLGAEAAALAAVADHQLRHDADAVVGGERDDHVLHADLLVDEVEQLADRPVEPQDRVQGLRGVRAEAVADRVEGGEAERKQVGDIVGAQVLGLDQGLGEVLEVAVEEGRPVDGGVEGRPFDGVAAQGVREGVREQTAVERLDVVRRGVLERQQRRPGGAEERIETALGVEVVEPLGLGVRVAVVSRRRPTPGRAAVPPGAVGVVPAHQDRRPVLAAGGEDLGLRIGGLEEIAQGRDEQVARRHAVVGVAAAVRLVAGLSVEPAVADDPVPLGERARGQGGVAGGGLGGGVEVVGVGEGDALAEQPAQAVREQGAETLEVVGPHLIDGDQEHESGRAFGDGGRRFGRGFGLRGGRETAAGRRKGQGGQQGEQGLELLHV